MSITTWLTDEKPREKLMAKGASSLSNSELLAILLRTGKKGKTAVDLARELLQGCGGLHNLLNSEKSDLCKFSGIGSAKYAQLQAAVELARRQLQHTLENSQIFSDIEITKQYLRLRLNKYDQEVFSCMFLNNKHRLICYEELFFGTINCSTIYPREVVKRALQHNAAALILAHNHPSGDAQPSQADFDVTYKLMDALKIVDVKVLDHVIVGSNYALSFLTNNFI